MLLRCWSSRSHVSNPEKINSHCLLHPLLTGGADSLSIASSNPSRQGSDSTNSISCIFARLRMLVLIGLSLIQKRQYPVGRKPMSSSDSVIDDVFRVSTVGRKNFDRYPTATRNIQRFQMLNKCILSFALANQQHGMACTVLGFPNQISGVAP